MAKIKQLFSVLKFFRDPIREKYNMVTYTNINSPVFLFGCYQSQHYRLLNHKGFAVICWTGSDALQLQRSPIFIDQLKNKPNIKHIAISKFISDDLNKLGIAHKHIPVTPFQHNDIDLHPRGNKIYVYSAIDNAKFYREELSKKIARETGMEIIVAHKDSYTRAQLLKIYQECFLGLRITSHDGFPNTCAEMGLMGRRVIHNGAAPNCIPYTSEDSIKNIIKTEYANRKQDNRSIRDSMMAYMDIGDQWLDTDFWNGNKPAPEKIIPIPGKVSVVMNSYNEKPEYLKAAIESYLNQKHVQVELIVSMVEGDQNIPFVAQYVEKSRTGSNKHGSVDIVTSDKPGIYTQLNNALKHITGDWYCYASSNDVALEDKLYHEVSTLIRTGKKVCYSSFIKCNQDLAAGKKYVSPPYNLAAHYKGNFVNDCAMITVDLLKKYAPFKLEFNNHAYYDFWLRIAKGEGPQVFIHSTKQTWLYRINKDSQHIKRSQNPTLIKKNQNDLIVMRDKHKIEDDGSELHFVYVYKKSSAVWQELAYSVRSIRKHYQGRAKIFVVGDAPGIRGVIHIAHKVEEGTKVNKSIDSILKLKLIANHPDINEEFVYMYDDIILLNKVSKADLLLLIAHNQVDDINEYITKLKRVPSKNWINLFRITFHKLQKYGKGSWNYETHLPRIFNKSKVIEVIDRFDMMQQPLLFASAYFNYFNAGPTTTLAKHPHFKVGFYHPVNSLERIRRDMKFKKFLNYDDVGLTKELKQVIREQGI